MIDPTIHQLGQGITTAAAVGGVGVAGGLAMLIAIYRELRARGRDQVTEGGVYALLKEELARLQASLAQARTDLDRLRADCEAERRECADRIEQLHAEVTALRAAALRRGLGGPGDLTDPPPPESAGHPTAHRRRAEGQDSQDSQPAVNDRLTTDPAAPRGRTLVLDGRGRVVVHDPAAQAPAHRAGSLPPGA